MRGDHKDFAVPVHQADAVLNQANPVSGTKYTVLNTTQNVRIIGISTDITWTVTQPTPLEVHLTIDGQALKFTVDDPVSGTNYFARINSASAPTLGSLVTTDQTEDKVFLLEGRSVKVEVEITWATTQPTPLNCRVIYAKW